MLSDLDGHILPVDVIEEGGMDSDQSDEEEIQLDSEQQLCISTTEETNPRTRSKTFRLTFLTPVAIPIDEPTPTEKTTKYESINTPANSVKEYNNSPDHAVPKPTKFTFPTKANNLVLTPKPQNVKAAVSPPPIPPKSVPIVPQNNSPSNKQFNIAAGGTIRIRDMWETKQAATPPNPFPRKSSVIASPTNTNVVKNTNPTNTTPVGIKFYSEPKL